MTYLTESPAGSTGTVASTTAAHAAHLRGEAVRYVGAVIRPCPPQRDGRCPR